MQKPLIALFAFFALAVPAQAQPTPAQRQACEQDAYKFCEREMPDEARVKRCLMINMRRLNPVCRSAFQRGRRIRRRHR